MTTARFLLLITIAAVCSAQPRPGEAASETVRRAQALVRQGNFDAAVAAFQEELKSTPDSAAGNNGMGILLDLMGRGAEARKYFQRAIDGAANPQAKANAQRALAMSYAFEGDCKNAAKAEQAVFDYWVSRNDAYQQGEIANEAARVCIDAGDLDTAEQWYEKGYAAGMKEPDIKPERVALWKFRMEHARARLAARRGKKAEAMKHVAAAKAVLDSNAEMAKAQAVFYPYLVGYVALYTGDPKTAAEELQKANQNDPFIQSLTGLAYERMGDKAKAREYYERAASTTAHNPPAAFARPFATRKLREK